MSPHAVLFDFDGVIADTENVHVAAWERTFAAMGWDVPPEVCALAAEQDDRAFLADVFAGRGISDGDVSGWVRRKQAETVTMLDAYPRLIPGVRELIVHLEGKSKLAIVSVTWRENILSVLRASGLEEAFALIVAKEDVKATKPDPEAYRLALKRLELKPAEAVALEDSPSGLNAAKGAGIRVIAVGHGRGAGEWAGDGAYIPAIANLAEVLRAIG